MKRKNNLTKGTPVFRWVAFAVLSFYAILIIVPAVWGFICSFKSEMDFSFNILGLPSQEFGGWQPENYIKAYQLLWCTVDTPEGGTRYALALEMFGNSLFYSIGCTIIAVLSHTLMAYVACKYKVGVSKLIYGIVIFVMTTPIVGNLPGEIRMAKSLGVYDNLYGIWVMKGGFTSMYFLIIYATLSGIPNDYSEAAKLDGAGHWTIFLRIILPMLSTTLTAVGLMFFMGYWNEYYTPMVYLPSYPTIAYALYDFQFPGRANVTTPIQLAASFIVGIPLVILVFLLRKKLIGTISVGGLKG